MIVRRPSVAMAAPPMAAKMLLFFLGSVILLEVSCKMYVRPDMCVVCEVVLKGVCRNESIFLKVCKYSSSDILLVASCVSNCYIWLKNVACN